MSSASSWSSPPIPTSSPRSSSAATSSSRRRAFPRRTRCSSRPSRRASRAQRARAGLPLGAGAGRRSSADAGGDRNRRQDDGDPVGHRDAARRRPTRGGRRQHGRAAGRRARSRRRCVRRRVHELPAGGDRAVPRRGRGVAQPRRGSSQLAHLDGVLRGGQGAGVHAATGHGHGDRRDRRSRRDGPPRVGTGAATGRSVCATPTITSPATCSRARPARWRPRLRWPAACPTT